MTADFCIFTAAENHSIWLDCTVLEEAKLCPLIHGSRIVTDNLIIQIKAANASLFQRYTDGQSQVVDWVRTFKKPQTLFLCLDHFCSRFESERPLLFGRARFLSDASQLAGAQCQGQFRLQKSQLVGKKTSTTFGLLIPRSLQETENGRKQMIAPDFLLPRTKKT